MPAWPMVSYINLQAAKVLLVHRQSTIIKICRSWFLARFGIKHMNDTKLQQLIFLLSPLPYIY